ncbi:hypothetical protein JYT88_02005 [Rhodospirillaceae bacterium AH-315-P19]|nr:hypothetical protein [Rhodospirillaceae bacterium AH-315-P19]
MSTKYSGVQRREYLTMLDRVGESWLGIFADDQEFYSTAYWDLLTGIWRNEKPVRKTDALKFMRAIRSAHTAGKYLDAAITKGIVEETANPRDARSKLVQLTPGMRARLDVFFDTAVGEMQEAYQRIGESPSATEES